MRGSASADMFISLAARGIHMAENIITSLEAPSSLIKGNEDGNIYQVDNLASIVDNKLSDSKDDDCIYNPFANSSMMQRTPPTLARNRCLARGEKSLPSANKKNVTTDTNTEHDRKIYVSQQSSEMESIIRLRIREEQQMQKCIESIARMKATMFKQRNTSTDIKNGITELEEAFDFMLKYRKDWMFIEKDLRTKSAVKDKTTQVSLENGKLHDQGRVLQPHRVHDATSKGKDGVDTTADQRQTKAQIASQKRCATSPVEQGKEKKKKENKSSDNWTTVEGRKNRRRQNKEQGSSEPAIKEGEKPRGGRYKRGYKLRPDALHIRPAQDPEGFYSNLEMEQNVRKLSTKL
ncbi:hypothetical protein KM043_018821 [Ampulex compressa]|nr:hypothetical protein KM043_018821 [Ampulex compressa]